MTFRQSKIDKSSIVYIIYNKKIKKYSKNIRENMLKKFQRSNLTDQWNNCKKQRKKLRNKRKIFRWDKLEKNYIYLQNEIKSKNRM